MFLSNEYREIFAGKLQLEGAGLRSALKAKVSFASDRAFTIPLNSPGDNSGYPQQHRQGGKVAGPHGPF